VLQISMEFRNLSKVYQDVISDICHKMGVGMAEFLEKKVDSQHEWDKVSQPGQRSGLNMSRVHLVSVERGDRASPWEEGSAGRTRLCGLGTALRDSCG